MKKNLAALALVLLFSVTACLSAVLAEEAVKMEVVEIEGFIGFALPSDWEYPLLNEEEQEQGMLIVGADREKNLMLTLSFHGPYRDVTTQALMDEFQSYANVELVENKHGTQVVRYEYLDGTLTGFYVLADNGLVYAFSYGHLDGTLLQDDEPILSQILEDSVQIVYFPAE
ncbi:MAG: hypothetical protein J6K72_03940 [Clostridia bacterium]|nr:hypothetical protein [Clostridia bacterium]